MDCLVKMPGIRQGKRHPGRGFPGFLYFLFVGGAFMSVGRRTFLGKAVAGMAALAAMLSPARAFGCRRRGSACSPSPYYGPTFFPGPVYQPVALPIVVEAQRDVITIEYPDETPVKGGGGLYTWGTNSVPILSIELVPNDGSINMATVPMGSGGTKPTWARRIDGLTVGTEYTLSVYYPDMTHCPPVKTLGASFKFTPQ
jgi:hypothetical protein